MSVRVLLYGASEGGRQTLQQLSRSIKVVAFIDSDPSKHGKHFENYPIEPPESVSKLHYDYILISSMHVDPIRQRLLDLGVPNERIANGLLFVNAPPAFPWDAILFITICSIAIIAISFTAIVTLLG